MALSNANPLKARSTAPTHRGIDDHVTRSGFMLLVALGTGLAGCSGDPGDPSDGTGGFGGTPGGSGSGGSSTSGGTANPGTGGSATSGGAAFGGMATSGGASSGGSNTGGSSSGGTSSGGFAGGGSSNGGAANGGAAGSVSTSGGNSNGGTSTGGAGTSAGGNAGSGGKSTSGGSAGTSGGGGKGGQTGQGGTPSTGGAAGNTGTGGGAVCTGAIPTPPSEMKETIDITWKEMSGGFAGKTGARSSSRNIQTYKSWALDHVMWSGGNLNFCVRWDSTVKVSTAVRDQVASALDRGVNAWFTALAGYDCFPYTKINVKVTGWAVRDRATLDWTDDSVPVYVNQLEENAPTCPATCARFSHQDKNYTFAQCPGGAQNRFDQFVWLDQDYNAPNGWDMGCHVNQADFVSAFSGTGMYHIWLHEFGHSIGFPDYYDWSSWTSVAAPKCVMNAGAAITVTDWDKWMLKRTWSELLRMNRWP